MFLAAGETESQWSTARFPSLRRLFSVFSSSSPSLDSCTPPETSRLEPVKHLPPTEPASKTTPRRRVKWFFDGNSRPKRRHQAGEEAAGLVTADDDIGFTVENRKRNGGITGTPTISGAGIQSQKETDMTRPGDGQARKLVRGSKLTAADRLQRGAPPVDDMVTWYNEVSARQMKLKPLSSSTSNVHSTSEITHRRPPTGNRTVTSIGGNEATTSSNGRAMTSGGTLPSINQRPGTGVSSSMVADEPRGRSWSLIERESKVRSTMSNVSPRPLCLHQQADTETSVALSSATRSISNCVTHSSEAFNVHSAAIDDAFESSENARHVTDGSGATPRRQQGMLHEREDSGRQTATVAPSPSSWAIRQPLVPINNSRPHPIKTSGDMRPEVQQQGSETSSRNGIGGGNDRPKNKTSSPVTLDGDKELLAENCRRLESMLSECRDEMLSVRATMIRNKVEQARLFDEERRLWETERTRLALAAGVDVSRGRHVLDGITPPRDDSDVIGRLSSLNRSNHCARYRSTDGSVIDPRDWQLRQLQLSSLGRLSDRSTEKKVYNAGLAKASLKRTFGSPVKVDATTSSLTSTPQWRRTSTVVDVVSGYSTGTPCGGMTSKVDNIRRLRQRSMDLDAILSQETRRLERLGSVSPSTSSVSSQVSTESHGNAKQSPPEKTLSPRIAKDAVDRPSHVDVTSGFKGDSSLVDDLRLELGQCRADFDAARRRWANEKRVVVEYHLRLERHLAQTAEHNRILTDRITLLTSELERRGDPVSVNRSSTYALPRFDMLDVEEMV